MNSTYFEKLADIKGFYKLPTDTKLLGDRYHTPNGTLVIYTWFRTPYLSLQREIGNKWCEAVVKVDETAFAVGFDICWEHMVATLDEMEADNCDS